MFDPLAFTLFVAAALAIALTPGPGILYVAARSLAGGRADGIASSVGTGIGGLVHIVAGACGVSAILLASAEVFTLFKLLGAAYLVFLGVQTIRSAGQPLAMAAPTGTSAGGAFRQGILVEALNPKTAAFFLAFLPQFVDPARGEVALQFVLLGVVSVVLNTAVDIVVAFGAAAIARQIAGRPAIVRRLRYGSGATMCGLGALLAFARRPAAG
ncbi:threonine/homoserine/homoserine lactone efflux protein [Stella humosa]|uniref:Threonine/homoserine/homoserine lactone efflux protein n=1 Tax=Stella humosa TaxID=94 RepID=A0A3N1L218_9PROT|nr:LysE family translocator [Stella humosa]ROP84638.1 threonine/homoserine/homoserine lactone efflux protein [Stella humosa]BBK34158.1 RhtB family transporter [Stella humosa]